MHESVENFTKEVYGWLLINGTKLLIGVIVLIIGLKLIKFLRAKLVERMSKRQVHSSLQPFFLSLTITSLYVLLIIAVTSIVGVPLSAFATVIGGFSVALGLALSGTFQNFAGGVLILLLKPFELDNSIVAQGQEGKVTSIQIFYTVLLTVDNRTIIIPNGKLFNEVIVNVSRENRRRLDFEFRVGYSADIEKARNIVMDMIKADNTILPDFPIRVGVVSLDVDNIRFTVNVWVKPDDYLSTKINLMENIVKQFAAAGISFPKPGS